MSLTGGKNRRSDLSVKVSRAARWPVPGLEDHKGGIKHSCLSHALGFALA